MAYQVCLTKSSFVIAADQMIINFSIKIGEVCLGSIELWLTNFNAEIYYHLVAAERVRSVYNYN